MDRSVILGILWLVCHNPEINQRIEEVKMTRYPKECEKQQKSKQRKLVQQKQKKEQKTKKVRREGIEKERKNQKRKG